MTAQTVSSAVAKRDDGIVKMMWSHGTHISAVLPGHLSVKSFIGTAAAALYASDVAGKDVTLMKCAQASPDSLVAALMRCAALGHQPGTDEFYLTPRKVKGRLTVQGIEGYRGIIERMYRSGAVASVVVREVCANDEFEYIEGVHDKPVHKVAWFGGGRGDMVGVYAYAVLTTGATSRVAILSRDDVMAAKEASDAGSSSFSPWNRPDGGKDHPEFTGRSMWWKGLALGTPIPTPSGWTTMGDIRLGDPVLDRDGSPVVVTGLSEIKHKDCYRLTFRSGPSITCDDEHLWVARIKRENERVHPISDLYAAKLAGKRVVIPAARPIDLPSADLPVDPWLLGYWLGDGNRTAGRVTVHSSEASEVVAAIRSAGYIESSVRADPRGQCVDISIRGLAKVLAELGVLGDKHVPPIYLRGSAMQRLALLRGLMDSDGSAEASRSRVRFGNTSRDMRDAVAELARSLGEQVLTFDRNATGYGKTVRFFEATWTPSVVPFTLARKAASTRLRTVRRGHSVTAIDRVESVSTVCIQVDSPTSTFLAGIGMIPTHNTAARRLEPWVPTSAEYRREQLRAASAASDLAGHRNGPPAAMPAATPPDVVDAEIVDDTPDTSPAAEQVAPVPAAPSAPRAEPAGEARTPRATSGQVSIIRNHFARLGFDLEDPDAEPQALRNIAMLAGLDELDTVTRLDQERAARVIKWLAKCSKASDLEKLLHSGEVPDA